MKKRIIFASLIVLSGISSAQIYDGPCCLGNFCTNTANPLFASYQVALNNHDFFFTDDANLTTKVNVGYNCGTNTVGKFNVFTNSKTNGGTGYPESISIYAKNEFQGSTNYGVYGEAVNLNSSGIPIGIFGDAKDGSGINVGVEGIGGRLATTIGTSYGAWFGSGYVGNNNNVGITGYAGNALTSNTGVRAVVKPSSGIFMPLTWAAIYPANCNIGLYASANTANSAGGSPAQDWAGWFDGDVFVNGVAYYPGMSVIASDRKFKKDIKGIENACDLIKQLKPSTYFLNTKNDYGMTFSDRKQFGFISQEVETVLPDLVEDVHKPEMKDDNGNVIVQAVDYKALNYMGFIAVLTKGMQEQQKQIEEQKVLISELQSKVKVSSGINELNGVNEYKMEQNEPNPFSGETTIKYSLPESVKTANLLVYDLTGKQIATFPINKKGSSSLTITSENLAAGIYIYSIVADGQMVDSKRMVVAEK